MNFWQAVTVMLDGNVVKEDGHRAYKIIDGELYVRGINCGGINLSSPWERCEQKIGLLAHKFRQYEIYQEQLNWHEAVQAMKDGKKVTRPSTSDYYVVLKSGRFIYAKQTNTHWFTNFNLTLEHLEATDWVVVD